jgi:electron transfer flavoprotein alpha subunit
VDAAKGLCILLVVADNQDEEAGIFEITDFGVDGDLFKVAPQATEELKKRQ